MNLDRSRERERRICGAGKGDPIFPGKKHLFRCLLRTDAACPSVVARVRRRLGRDSVFETNLMNYVLALSLSLSRVYPAGDTTFTSHSGGFPEEVKTQIDVVERE